MLKMLHVKIKHYVNWELPDVHAGFRRGRGTRDQIATIHWVIEKAREFQKNIYFCFIDNAKAFDCVDHNKLWKILQEMGIPDGNITFSASWEICMQVKKQQNRTWNNRTRHGTADWTKLGKPYVKAVYCHPTYLTYMQSTSWETLGWRKHKLELQICRWYHLYGRQWRRTKEPLDESERREWKRWLKTQFQKTKIMSSIPSLHGK